MRSIVYLWILVFQAGCATVPCPPAHLNFEAERDTGLRGQVLRGPVCPGPSRLDRPECEEAPFSATFLVFWGEVYVRWGEYVGGCQVGAFRSDEYGRFEIALPPGRYTIYPDADAGLVNPSMQRQLVEVGPEGFTEVTLRFDTGMR